MRLHEKNSEITFYGVSVDLSFWNRKIPGELKGVVRRSGFEQDG